MSDRKALLERVHKRVAGVGGRLSLALTGTGISRESVDRMIRELREAVEILERMRAK